MPVESADLTMRSRLTEGSALSIFATLDWLDPIRSANCAWEILT